MPDDDAASKILSAIALVRADIALVSTEVGVVKGGLANVVARVDLIEARKPITSERVQAMVSDGDLVHEAKLAEEIVARKSLAAKVDGLDTKQDTQLAILTRLESITKNPLVKTIATAIGTAFLTWLSMKGLR